MSTSATATTGTTTVGPLNLLRPILILLIAASHLPSTLFRLVRTRQLSALTSWSSFQHSWFSDFWNSFGQRSRDMGAPAVEPLLKQARGVVLDIGPGSGLWVELFAAAAGVGGTHEDEKTKISKIYGVEPNASHHPALRHAVKAAGLQDVYEILPVGVQDLQTCGIALASVDTIATIQVLCSVPGPEKIVKDLYPYLKPGGTWLVYEHVRTHYRQDFVAWWQDALNYIWPHFLDGCCINRPTDEWLLQAGEWDQFNLKPGQGEGKWDSIPHVVGTIVKKR